MLTFEDKLSRFASLLLHVGIALPPEGKVHISAPIEAAELVRRLVREAYASGALHVAVQFSDPVLARVTTEAASEAAMDYAPAWAAEERLRKVEDDYGFVNLYADDPDLLAGLDPERVARLAATAARANRPFADHTRSFSVNWTIGAMPVPSWAAKVFPDLAPDEAVARLWDAIFTVTRADRDDPVAAWRDHLADLAARRDWLNDRRFAALHFRGPGTDLRVGLADGHDWAGGAWPAKNGRAGVPNFPTDEVFTAPHRDRVDGVVRATKPVSVRGVLIEDIVVRFENGRVVEATASRGEDALRRLLDTDEGARHLGEVALVPASAPVARTGLLFYNTLFDENAASHLALGAGYPFTLRDGATREAQDAAGLNDSLIHVDWMIGSAEIDVDGVSSDGTVTPVMRGGEWAF